MRHTDGKTHTLYSEACWHKTHALYSEACWHKHANADCDYCGPEVLS